MNNINTLAFVARINGIENIFNDNNIIKEFNETMEFIPSIEESMIHSDTSVVPVHKFNESYVVTLDSLLEVSESFDISLEESMNMIKNENNISDADVSCMLPEGINEYMSAEEFCELSKILNENNINISLVNEYTIEEFVNESVFGKIKEGIGSVVDTLQERQLKETIRKNEKYNDNLRAELEYFNKMDSASQTSYLIKHVVKSTFQVMLIELATNVAVAATAGAGGTYMILKGYTTLDKFDKASGAIRTINFIAQITAGSAFLINKGKKGKPIAFTPSDYKKAINNTIRANTAIINKCKAKLKKIQK